METQRQQEILRDSKCHEVESPEEAGVLVRALESVLENQGGSFPSLSAPEINIKKKVAIIRTFSFNMNLINPIILERRGRLLSFKERCSSFPKHTFNCMRYEHIVLQNGLNGNKKELKGLPALIVQHEVDHLNGKIFQDRAIKFAVVRDGGRLKDNDLCPCGSKQRFSECCQI